MIFRAIDFETTGIPTETDKHAVAEWARCDIGDIPDSMLCDPGRPIPHEAMAVHHITDAMVKGFEPFDPAVLGTPDYFAAHNADYERQFFTPSAPVICTYKVALRVWKEAPSHSLQFLRYHLDLPVDEHLAMPPHRAGPDAYLCSLLLERLLAEGTDVETMVRWSSGPALFHRVNFGKHEGMLWSELPSDYLNWMAFKAPEMDRDRRANAKYHLTRRGEL